MVGALAPAGMEAHVLVGLLVLRAPVPDPRGVARLAVLVVETDDRGHEGLAVLRHPVARIGVGEDELAVRHDLQIGAGAGDLLAVGGLQAQSAWAYAAAHDV